VTHEMLFQNRISKIFPYTCKQQYKICNKIPDYNPCYMTDIFIQNFIKVMLYFIKHWTAVSCP